MLEGGLVMAEVQVMSGVTLDRDVTVSVETGDAGLLHSFDK